MPEIPKSDYHADHQPEHPSEFFDYTQLTPPPEDGPEPTLPEAPRDLQEPVPDGPEPFSDADAVDYVKAQLDQSEQSHLDTSEALERANVDAVTGLLTKRALYEAIQNKYALSLVAPVSAPDHDRRQPAPPKRVVVIYADVCDLKAYNDSRGHAAGDELLRGVADELTHHVRPGDLVARVGGDEIAIVMDVPDALPPIDLEQFKRDRLAAFRQSGLSDPRPKAFSDYDSSETIPALVAFGASAGDLRPLSPAERSVLGEGAPATTFDALSHLADADMYVHKEAIKQPPAV